MEFSGHVDHRRKIRQTSLVLVTASDSLLWLYRNFSGEIKYGHDISFSLSDIRPLLLTVCFYFAIEQSASLFCSFCLENGKRRKKYFFWSNYSFLLLFCTMFCVIYILYLVVTFICTELKITRVQHGFDMMSSFFALGVKRTPDQEWAHQNERRNN